MDVNKINNLGAKFNRETYLKAREVCIKAVEEVAAKVELGMSEEDGHQLIEFTLKEKSYERFWHPHKFRIGKNTRCAFRDQSDPNIRLQKNDIFFIDIGPIFNDHETDFGRTFVFGENDEYTKIAKASEDLFLECEAKWLKDQLSGKELYKFASLRAQEMGYQLEDRQSGHRLGDFPHALHYRGRLGEVDSFIVPDLWVLEIHLLHNQLEAGAFFEDILKA